MLIAPATEPTATPARLPLFDFTIACEAMELGIQEAFDVVMKATKAGDTATATEAEKRWDRLTERYQAFIEGQLAARGELPPPAAVLA